MRVEQTSFLPLFEQNSPKENSAISFEKMLDEVNQELLQAQKAQEKLMSGQADNLLEIMSSIEKADISLRMVTEIRNKAIEAYQEVMRMQV
ncbi:MAG: flagellar hook-basal body complex protein FliE [Epsilonproteobacteria bacterium]|nr:flagellar hook-basal body complex protein FliE [Campylobacterota bacterium]